MVLRTTLRRLLHVVLARVGEPLQRPLWGSIRILEHRADALESAATRLTRAIERADEEAGSAAAPLLLDAVATQHAGLRAATRRDREVWATIEGEQRRLTELAQRLEVVRREVLFELRYGRTERTGDQPAAVQAMVLNEAKVAAMGQALRLNVGSGTLAVEGYLNVDARAIDGVDVVAEVGDLPFDDGSVLEVRSAHVLEHFPEEELRRRVLPHWVAKLQPGGVVRSVVPDALSMMRAWSEGALPFADLREVTFGAQDYEGDFHFTMFSAESLAALLAEAGLVEVEVVEEGRRNGLCLEMELVARKPEGGGSGQA